MFSIETSVLFPPSLLHRLLRIFDRPVMDVGDAVPFDFTRSVSSLVGVQEGLRTHEQQAETLKKSQHMVPL